MGQISNTVGTILKGLKLYVLAGIVGAILGTISAFMTAGALVAAATGSGGATAGMGVGLIIISVLSLICSIIVIYGLFVYYGGLKGLAPQLDEVGRKAVKNIATATLLMMINAVLGCIAAFVPLVFAIPMAIIAIIAFILNIMGYSSLGGSTSLNELGKAGAKKLFLGFILAIVAVIFGWVPVVGGIIALVLNILYWVFLFQGWGKIKKSFE